MVIQNKFYCLELSNSNGEILSFKNAKGREFILSEKCGELFALLMINDKNESVVLSGNNTENGVTFSTENDQMVLSYSKVCGYDINVKVFIRHPENEPFVYWKIQVNNHSGLHLDKIDFPKVIVPNDLVATGGTGRIFTSMMEGLVVEDASIRESFSPILYTDGVATGWGGKYPGACATQFSAYYCDMGGLYLAAHDKYCNPKIIEYYKENGGIKLEFKLYPGMDDTSNFMLEFEMVLGVFDGDWYDAADIYRKFIEESDIIQLPKLKNNKNIPEWLKADPIIVCYPVRGEIDSEIDETKIEEYFPYTKATPYMKELQNSLDSAVMPLLMHWEGTAPWAPPYVWPPYGDVENFHQYIKELHDSGNFVGVYCSGISWTDQSLLVPSYNKKKEFEEENWQSALLVGPDQTTDYTWKMIRQSYELCPACQKTKDVAINEFEKIIAGCDVDYVQFFDQNLGGGTYACYGRNHGHCFGPGKWKNEEMLKIAEGMHSILRKYDKEDKVLIGCEGNAAEPFVNHFIFNDSRHNINYWSGNPVSAYNYIFHEYVCNFMGNQNTSSWTTDFGKNPENIYYRYAHSFVQGDILTVVLKNKGQIHWDWCTPWDAPEIDQKAIRSYIGGLNSWRKNVGKEALLYGRMVKPFAYDCGLYEEDIINGGKHTYKSVEAACYLLDNGRKQQVFVNFLPYEQKIKVYLDKDVKATLIEDPFGKIRTTLSGEQVEIVVPARMVKILELEN